MHEKAHDESLSESRGDLLILRGLRVFNEDLKLSGICDVVEFHKDPNGIHLHGHDGLWIPFPVEYKRGHPKEDNCDQLQLCAQAMCLEKMFMCQVSKGCLYYGETRHRQSIDFTDQLKKQVIILASEMHSYYDRHYTPLVKPKKHCASCSLKDICLPKLAKHESASSYIQAHIGDDI